MALDETQARDIARRWGQVSDSQPLLEYAKTGLIADRKRLTDAINGVRVFLKDPVELDDLLNFIQTPCQHERAARQHGWAADSAAIYHVHDYDRSVRYRNWAECCESEDIVVEDDPQEEPRGRRRRG
jgi:hypothetical protein